MAGLPGSRRCRTRSWGVPAEPFGAVVAIIIGLGILTVIGDGELPAPVHRDHRVHARRGEDPLAGVLAFSPLPLGGIVAGNASDRISRLLADTAALNRGFIAVTSRVTKGAVMLVVAMVIDWRWSIVTIVVAPDHGDDHPGWGKRIRRAIRGRCRGRRRLLGNATEVVHGFRVVKVYGSEPATERFNVINNEVVRGGSADGEGARAR